MRIVMQDVGHRRPKSEEDADAAEAEGDVLEEEEEGEVESDAQAYSVADTEVDAAEPMDSELHSFGPKLFGGQPAVRLQETLPAGPALHQYGLIVPRALEKPSRPLALHSQRSGSTITCLRLALHARVTATPPSAADGAAGTQQPDQTASGSDDEELMGDDEMFQMDKALAAAVGASVKSGGDARQAAQHLLSFKQRVLGLLEIYVKKVRD